MVAMLEEALIKFVDFIFTSLLSLSHLPLCSPPSPDVRARRYVDHHYPEDKMLSPLESERFQHRMFSKSLLRSRVLRISVFFLLCC